MKLNIIKTDFFIFLTGYKNNNVFINFCYNSYKDDFYILIPAKPLKVKLNKLNALERGTPKLILHKLKDRRRFKVLKGINIGNNGFKNPSSWESIEKKALYTRR